MSDRWLVTLNGVRVYGPWGVANTAAAAMNREKAERAAEALVGDVELVEVWDSDAAFKALTEAA